MFTRSLINQSILKKQFVASYHVPSDLFRRLFILNRGQLVIATKQIPEKQNYLSRARNMGMLLHVYDHCKKFVKINFQVSEAHDNSQMIKINILKK